jgi:probable phosphoglycerate mutase
MEIGEEPDLREVHLGDWEGGEFRIRAAAGDPVFRRIWEEERWDVIPGSEPHDAFDERVWRGFQRIVAAHHDQRVMAVAHGGVIGQLLHRVTGARRFAFSGADNGSISEVVASPDRIILRRYNDVSHLLPLLNG